MNETRNINTLKNWDKNPRNIKDKDFQRLKKQIIELGQYKPLLITKDGTVIGGNMRLRAYRDLGITEVWVSVVDADTEDKILKYALSDNDRAGYYDDDLLSSLQSEYPDFDWGDYAVDLDAPKTLDDMFEQEVEEDEVPEVSGEEPISKLGEIYQLGRHRLMCGDSTKIEDVEKLMDGNKADMVFTDPPYGMNAVSNSGVLRENYGTDILNDDNTQVAIDSFNMCQAFGIKKQVWWGANYYSNVLPPSSCWLVWDKNNGESDQMDCELAWSNLNGVTRQFTESSEKINRVHPTQKPVALSSWVLKKYGGDIVLDLFGGSGSTLIACEQLNRTCYMMELDPKYCDVIRKRYAKFIGKEDEWQKVTQVDQPK